MDHARAERERGGGAARQCRRLATALGLALLLGAVRPGDARAAEIRVLSGGALRPALEALLPRFEGASQHTVKIAFAPAGEIARRIAAGERFDLLLVPAENIDAYEQQGVVVAGARAPLAQVGIGVAVKAGAPAPDISTPEAFKQALLSAKSIAYVDPERGTSGKHLAGVIEKLGIAAELQPKTTLIPGGSVADPVSRGEVELGLQQISEILPVAGARLVGPLPAALQKQTVYSAVPMTGAPSAEPARELIRFLTSAPSAAVFREKGFTAP